MCSEKKNFFFGSHTISTKPLPLYTQRKTNKTLNQKPMEDIDTTMNFNSHSDEDLMMNEVIQDNSDLYFLHCCLGELFAGRVDE